MVSIYTILTVCYSVQTNTSPRSIRNADRACIYNLSPILKFMTSFTFGKTKIYKVI